MTTDHSAQQHSSWEIAETLTQELLREHAVAKQGGPPPHKPRPRYKAMPRPRQPNYPPPGHYPRLPTAEEAARTTSSKAPPMVPKCKPKATPAPRPSKAPERHDVARRVATPMAAASAMTQVAPMTQVFSTTCDYGLAPVSNAAGSLTISAAPMMQAAFFMAGQALEQLPQQQMQQMQQQLQRP